jgi:predicted dinucleotide-binding enzyme
MTTLGIIGSGNIGSTVARLALQAGYDVVISNSRGPETLVDLVAELGSGARAATAAEAAEAGDLVLVTVPLKAVPDLPVEPLAGKVVLDTCNYYPDRDGRIPGLEDESTTTSELVQAQLPSSQVVKVFNSIYVDSLRLLGRPGATDGLPALPIAGDSAEAKAVVTRFLREVGFATVDAGPLAEGWRFQRDTAAYVTPYFGAEGSSSAHAVTPEELQALLGQALRYRDLAA